TNRSSSCAPRTALVICALAATVTLAPAGGLRPASAKPVAALPPLIPRAVLFANPERAYPTLSPDGRRLAYLRRTESGELALWVRTLGATDDTLVTSRVGNYQWAGDGRHLLYIRDSDGDENFHIYSVDIETRIARDLTPFVGYRAENLMVDPRHPDEIL